MYGTCHRKVVDVVKTLYERETFTSTDQSTVARTGIADIAYGTVAPIILLFHFAILLYGFMSR